MRRSLIGEVLDVVRDLKREGTTMLLATHEMGFACEIADRVCFLHHGRIFEQGPPDELFGDPREERTRQFLQRVVDAGRLNGLHIAAELLPSHADHLHSAPTLPRAHDRVTGATSDVDGPDRVPFRGRRCRR